MKKLLSAILCLTVISGFVSRAQTVQYSVDVTPFRGIDISGPFEVNILRGNDFRVLITVLEPYRDYVECYVGAGVLNLTLDEKKVPSEIRRQFRGKGTPDPVYSAVIYVPDLLQNVHLSGKAVMKDSEDVYDKARITFSVAGNAVINKLSVSSLAFSLDMKDKSSADFVITCESADINMANSSSLKISEQSKNSVYSIQGSSKTDADIETNEFKLSSKGNSAMTLSGMAQTAIFDMTGTSEVDAERFDLADANVKMSSVCKLNVAATDNLVVNLNGGSSLMFAGDPVIKIENIRAATMSRIPGTGNSSRL